METPKFTFNNVDQCWYCKNMDGYGEHILEGYSFLLPYCKVCQADMVEVYDDPCRGFKQRKKG